MRPKSFTLDGKRYRLSPEIPLNSIAGHVARYPVGTPDEDICASIREAVGNSRDASLWTPRLILQAERLALSEHRRNQRLYAQVMGGGRVRNAHEMMHLAVESRRRE